MYFTSIYIYTHTLFLSHTHTQTHITHITHTYIHIIHIQHTHQFAVLSDTPHFIWCLVGKDTHEQGAHRSRCTKAVCVCVCVYNTYVCVFVCIYTYNTYVCFCMYVLYIHTHTYNTHTHQASILSRGSFMCSAVKRGAFFFFFASGVDSPVRVRKG
jgi:hypothetical protein